MLCTLRNCDRLCPQPISQLDPVETAIMNARSVLERRPVRGKAIKAPDLAKDGTLQAGSASPAKRTHWRPRCDGAAGQSAKHTTRAACHSDSRRLPIPVPPLFYDRGGRRNSPPGGAGPQSRRKATHSPILRPYPMQTSGNLNCSALGPQLLRIPSTSESIENSRCTLMTRLRR